MNERRISARPLTLSVALASVTAAACGTDDDVTFQAPAGRTPLAQETSIDGGPAIAAESPDAGTARFDQTVAHPDGRYRATTRAVGIGCAPGSWTSRFNRDGQLVVSFVGFDLEVQANTTTAIRDCRLSISLDTATPRAFALISAVAQGYAYLQQDVKASVDLWAYFDGITRPPVALLELAGPHDGVYTHSVSRDALDRWTPCNATRRLEVRERIILFNSMPPREGYMNLSSIDEPGAKLTLTFADRVCEK